MHIQPQPKFEIDGDPAPEFVGNGFRWKTTKKLTMHWVGPMHQLEVVIEPGFATDMASVPRPLWSFFPPQGLYNRAAVIHDYLCDEPDVDRVFADAMFLLICRRTGVPWTQWLPMYVAIRSYGVVKVSIKCAGRKMRICCGKLRSLLSFRSSRPDQ